MTLKFKDFVGQPCKSRTAFEFIPKQKTELDLQKTSKKLRQNNFKIEADTPVIIIVNCNGFPVSIFKNAKILVRETKDKEQAKKIIESLLCFLEKKQF